MKFQKGQKHSEETKKKMRISAKERWERKRRRDPKMLAETACSLCNDYSNRLDFGDLASICGRRCVIQKIWTRFLADFERRKNA